VRIVVGLIRLIGMFDRVRKALHSLCYYLHVEFYVIFGKALNMIKRID